MNANRLGYATFAIVEEQFGLLSAPGIILAAVLGIGAVILALMAPLWFPALSAKFEVNKSWRWLASPQFGRLLPFAIACFLFPCCGFFSSSIFTFWLFLLFGWGFGAILLYTGVVMDKWTQK